MLSNIKTEPRAFCLRMRAQYLNSIPEVRKEIQVIRSEHIKNSDIDKPLVISEIVSMLEEEKLRSSTEPSARKNRLTLIKMMGDCVGAFTTNIKIEEVDSSRSLEMLIEMAQADVEDGVKKIPMGTYTVEDSSE